MIPSEEEICGAIAQQAGEWFIANQAGPLTEEDGAALLAWLKASPVHVREYLGVARIAHHLPLAVGSPQVPLEVFLAARPPGDGKVVMLDSPASERPRVARRVMQALPIAASLLTLAVGLLWWVHDGELLGIPKSYWTAHGEYRIERLPDGSILRLDTDSEATVRYSGSERFVELNRGQALFEVVHEGNRRFRVTAGNAGVIAVGTRFDVYKKTGATEITVVEGEVAVFAGEPSWLSSAGAVPSQVQRVTAGYQVLIDASGSAAQPAGVDLDQTLGWLQQEIVFERRPLGEVAAEFNRYGKVPVEIEDRGLRTLQVSGVFDARDTESFVAFLATLPGVKVTRTATLIRVTREGT